MPTPQTVTDYLDLENQLDQERNQFKPQWQLVAEFIHQRRADFTTSHSLGAFITSHLWTDDPVHIAETSSSAFLGYMWSAGVKSFKLVGNKKVFEKDKEVADWWSETTETLQAEMDDPEAGLASALDESMLDLITIGTDAIYFEERNKDTPRQGCLLFDPWSVLEFATDENAEGRAVIFTRRREYKTKQLIEKYGYENVSKKARDSYDHKQYNERFQVLHVIMPRHLKDRKPGSKAAADMPYASIHIEVDQRKFLRRSGYQELPVACSRLAKRNKETYGRGRGMNALPSIMLLNQVWEDFSLALEFKLDPATYQLHDAVAGNGFIDKSAGANNILRINKALPNVPPFGKLFDVQDTRDIPMIIEKLVETISNHFMIDRLINLNNDVEMTKGEAFLRNAIRQSTLRSIVSRIMREKFQVVIDGSFMICLRRNKFGYVPNDPEARAREANGEKVRYIPEKVLAAMASGEDIYTIEYMTPAARDMMAEEGQGMVETLAICGEAAAYDPTVKHRPDWGWILPRLSEIKGADRRMWKKEADVKASVDAEAAQQKAANDAAVAQSAGKVAKDAAVAQNTLQK